MKKGFTLAEVLITLAIIGIVAALTIPTVVAKFQQRELYTRFINTYSIFSNIYGIMKADGLIDVDIQNVDDLLSRLKYTVKCNVSDTDNCTVSYKSLSGDVETGVRLYPRNGPVYTLSNGADFYVELKQHRRGGTDEISIELDTNGMDKGPNVIGKDYFEISFYPYQASPGFARCSYTSESYQNFQQNDGKLEYDDAEIMSSCDPNGSGDAVYGYSCGVRLLKEGKMDY